MCALTSPFNIYIDRISKEAKYEEANQESIDPQFNNINELLFADDQCVFYEGKDYKSTSTN
jgi:hypothetical protein